MNVGRRNIASGQVNGGGRNRVGQLMDIRTRSTQNGMKGMGPVFDEFSSRILQSFRSIDVNELPGSRN